MWEIFPRFGLLKILLAIFSALFLSVLILLIGPDGDELSWGNFGDSFKLAVPITLIFPAIIFSLANGAVFLEIPISWKGST